MNLKFYKRYNISDFRIKKISQQFVGSFKVKNRMKKLIYEIELLQNMKIHSIILIIYLKKATDPAKDPFTKIKLPLLLIMIDKKEEFEIDRLLAKRRIKKKRGFATEYLVTWKEWGSEYNM